MSNFNEQNGRQLPKEQAAPPTDPRTRGVKATAPPPPPPLETQKICRDYIWGICSMKDECRYLHHLDFESMKSILRFCHDYQNRTGCTRADCTYLHTSRDEQNLFLNHGVIPRVLAERYATIAGPGDTAMLFMTEYMAQPPPPPPPSENVGDASLAQTAPVPIQPMAQTMNQPLPQMAGLNAMPASITQNSHAQLPAALKVTLPAKIPSMSAAVPVAISSVFPPPPPPPPTVTTAITQMAGPVYTAALPMQQTAVYPVTPQPAQQTPPQPQYSLPLYDPSVPPPPFAGATASQASKRAAPGPPEAGPSKVAKINEPHESFCENCTDRNFRRELTLQEIEKLLQEEEYKRQDYDQKSAEFEKGRTLLRSMLSPHMFQAADEFIETSAASLPSTSSDIFAPSSSPTYNAPEVALPKQLLFELMQYMISKAHAEQQTNSLESLARRHFSQSDFSRLMRASDLQSFTSLLERLNNPSETRMPSLESLSSNGLSRLSNGSLEAPPAVVSRYAAPAPRAPAPAPAPVPAPRYNAPVYTTTQPIGYSGSQPPAYTAPQLPVYTPPQPPAYNTTPQPPAYTNPQPSAYSTPQPPVYSTPQPPAYTPPQPPAYNPPQPSYGPQAPQPHYQPEPPPPQTMYVPYQHQQTMQSPQRPFYPHYAGTNNSSYGAAPATAQMGPAPPQPGAPPPAPAPSPLHYQYVPRMPQQHNPYYRQYQ